MADTGPDHASLTADYASPDAVQSFQQSSPALSSTQPSHTVEEKTAYLAALRTGIKEMQDEVNTFLTQRMDEDKANDGTGVNGQKRREDEKAEETYGEEVEDEG